ncbi:MULTISPECIES: NYN domain-containing protein [Shewanella]|uniref:NYN domain-containing protein n=1 Tax=Shewanella TaxID=22 RepID=UPI000A58F416|nr:NYN domain-containing protein [Shewanella xiamenensis]
MKTRIYIDGYNLYFGCLKGTPHKWLDPISLSERLLARSGERGSILDEKIGVKFFTAEISEKAASDNTSLNDQRAYHLALHIHCASRLEIIKGSYAIDKTKFPCVEQDDNGNEKQPRDSQRVKIWKLEEKQSDVNVAIEAVYDAITEPDLKQVVFVTNDTDIAPALSKIRTYNKLQIRDEVKIGLIVPIKSNDDSRRANKSLSALADWTIHHITDEELAASQLPCRLPAKKKSAFKPSGWFKYPDRVQEILEILSDKHVAKSIPAAWNWLSKPLQQVEGLPNLENLPCNCMDDEVALETIRQHAIAYAKFKEPL